MPNPVAPLRGIGSSLIAATRFVYGRLRSPVQTLQSAAELPRYGVAAATVLARSGVLRPYRPHQLLGVARSIRLHGLNLGGLYAIGAALHGGRVAAIDDAGEASFAQMDQRSSTVAAALVELGVSNGDEVAVLCRNHRAFLVAVVALGKIGCDIVYLNTGFAGPQLAQVMVREGATALIMDQEFLALSEQLRPDLPVVLAWVDDPESLAGQLTFDRILATSRRPAPPAPGRSGRQIVLTSGTTGAPKGAQRGMGADPTPVLSLLSRIPLRTGDVTLLAAPMFHSWGLAHAALGLALGSTLVLTRRFEPESTLALIEARRVRVVVAVPVMIQRIMDLPVEVRRRYDTSSLQVVALSGSALPGELAWRFMDDFGDVIYNLYGSTEVGWASIATPADLRAAPGTAGRVPVGTRVRLLDDADQPVQAGQTGRIFVRNSILFDGYTGGGGKAVVDGYLSTGDVGHFDHEGRLFVDGRDDDMIVSGGENVFPREIEDLLHDHPDVVDVAVIGVPDPQYGQRLEGFVVLRAGAGVTADDLRRHVGAHLARYKVPRRIVELDELPRNATGKVLKRELRAP